jgi:hypothetical protein
MTLELGSGEAGREPRGEQASRENQEGAIFSTIEVH